MSANGDTMGIQYVDWFDANGNFEKRVWLGGVNYKLSQKEAQMAFAENIVNSGVWEVVFVYENDDGDEGVLKYDVIAPDKLMAVAVATKDVELETINRITRTLVRPFVSA